MAEIIFKPIVPDFKQSPCLISLLLSTASLYNIIVIFSELKNKLSVTPSNLEKMITVRHKSWSKKMFPGTLLQIPPWMLSLQLCSFIKSNAWELLLWAGIVGCAWLLLQNACPQIQTVCLSTRCVSVHMKSRENDSNRLT